MATNRRTKSVRPRAKRTKSTPGNKPHFFITPALLEECELLSGFGMTQQQLWDYFQISRSAWFEYIQQFPELGVAVRRGRMKAISQVAGKLFEAAMAGNVSAMIFYLKTQAGFSERLHITTPETPSVPTGLLINITDPVEAAKIYQQVMTGS
jgi:hypothetical protein